VTRNTLLPLRKRSRGALSLYAGRCYYRPEQEEDGDGLGARLTLMGWRNTPMKTRTKLLLENVALLGGAGYLLRKSCKARSSRWRASSAASPTSSTKASPRDWTRRHRLRRGAHGHLGRDDSRVHALQPAARTGPEGERIQAFPGTGKAL